MIFNFSPIEWGHALLDLFLPRTCIVCGKQLALREKHICIGCLADMPRTFFSPQRRNQMADRFNALVQRDLESVSPVPDPARKFVEEVKRAEGPVPYSYATALFFYRSGTGYRNITKRLKYHSDIGAGRYFAAMLAKDLAASHLFSDVDAVIPVPLHWTRRWSRGYNQAGIIAEVVARELGVPLRSGVLKRVRRTGSQTRLSVERKALNVAGAFKLGKSVDLSGCKHILLVDDVFTTGATLHSCYQALRSNIPPNIRISVATLACVGY